MNIQELVDKYEADRTNYLLSSYKETPLRNDFIDPLLKCMGWDVDNDQGKTQFLRDVVQEEAIEVEGESSKKSPDYTLRLNGIRKLFVEAKKPHVDINSSSRAAFQIRRYGWNANLGISILTNFEHLIIYDCRYKPDSKEDERVARVKVYHYSQYVSSFDEIYQLISFESALNGVIDDHFSVYENVGETFDHYFLSQIERWREILAQSAVEKNLQIQSDEVNFLTQRLLNRIIFLRICEDRDIERFETLKKIENYNQLKDLFRQSDRKYNSGLFDFIEDDLSLRIDIDASILIQIFNELYYPYSPYDFSVVDPTILSQIYEHFLGSRVEIGDARVFSMVREPEVTASSGVVSTPKEVVEHIVRETLTPLTFGKSSSDLLNLKIADICCGSGTFLISAFDFLVQQIIEKYLEEDNVKANFLYQSKENELSLHFKLKRDLLANCLYGVDINPYAVEVSEFSLLLKLLEGENKSTLDNYVAHHSGRILPSLNGNIKCGNSLVGNDFFEFMPDALEDDNILYRVNPFDWNAEFPFLDDTEGFDAIIGNPPYVRIQNLVKYVPEEIKYYQSANSPYSVTKKEATDKYYVFIQRAISLLNGRGFLGYIIPHKFFLIKGGANLRKVISENSQLYKIVHFGVNQVFPNRSTYVAIVVLQKTPLEKFFFKRANSKNIASLMGQKYIEYDTENYKTDPWIFLSPRTSAIFQKLYDRPHKKLKDVADICVGLQTSKDWIYILNIESETPLTYKFVQGEKEYEIEKEICLPCLYDASFANFDTVNPNTVIIFPYTLNEEKAELFTESYFEQNFPLCWEYLNDFKPELIKRSLNGKSPKWYQFGRSQSLTRFHNTDKLIWSVLSTSAPYAIDKQNSQFTGGGNGPYYSLITTSKYSLEYLMGILSHPVVEAMVKSGASEFRGAYYSHGKQFLENIPIPIIDNEDTEQKMLHDRIVKIVKSLITTKTQLSTEYTKRAVLLRKLNLLERELIVLVSELFGITEEEMNTALADEMCTNELNIEE